MTVFYLDPDSPSSLSSQTTGSTTHNNSNGIIVGIAAGIPCGLVLLTLIAVMFVIKKRQSDRGTGGLEPSSILTSVEVAMKKLKSLRSRKQIVSCK